MSQEIVYEMNDGVGRITFNRPEARNAFSFRMYERFAEICKQASRDSSVKVLVLTGANEKVIVQCKGRVVRVNQSELIAKIGIALAIEQYDFTALK